MSDASKAIWAAIGAAFIIGATLWSLGKFGACRDMGIAAAQCMALQ